MQNLSSILLRNSNHSSPDDLESFISHIGNLMPLLDEIPNIVFFVKDVEAKYVLINRTILARAKYANKDDIIGLQCYEVYSGSKGLQYMRQDFQVLKGKQISNKLELHNYLSGQLGWCITHKIPIYNKNNIIIGMAGISVDVEKDTSRQLKHHEKLGKIVDLIQENLEQKITVADLAKYIDLSVSQLERLFKSVLNLSPTQMLQKIRLEYAIQLLNNTNLSIIEIAVRCGYSDHSAFTRQFKHMTSLTPSAFRKEIVQL